MAANIIFLGTDTPALIDFTFTGAFSEAGLANFNNIELIVGGETHDLAGGNIQVESATRLAITIGNATQLTAGSYWPAIIGYNAQYDDGIVIAHKSLGLPNKLVIATVD